MTTDIRTPTAALRDAIADALAQGITVDEIHQMTNALNELARRVDAAMPDAVDALVSELADTVAPNGNSAHSNVHDPTPAPNPQPAPEPPATPDGLPLYTRDTLPDGLIDLPSATKKYGCQNARMRKWIARGRIIAHGRLRAPAPGGGYLVIAERDLIEMLS